LLGSATSTATAAAAEANKISISPHDFLSFRVKGRERKTLFPPAPFPVHYPTFLTFHFICVPDFSALILNGFSSFPSLDFFHPPSTTFFSVCTAYIVEKFFGNKLKELKLTIKLKKFGRKTKVSLFKASSGKDKFIQWQLGELSSDVDAWGDRVEENR
jgi:hypothetical protein